MPPAHERRRRAARCGYEPAFRGGGARLSHTVLAFDFGLRQIGVAVGNTLTQTGQALTVLKARDGIPDWAEVEKLVAEWQPEQLLVGNPLNMDDSESELSRLAQKFGNRLSARLRLPVKFMDERLSSFEAKQALREAGHRGDFKSDPADSLAARLILESWFRSEG